jgi:UPF0271 protein
LHGAYLGDAQDASQQGDTHIRQIDLNADLGEHDGNGYGADARLLALVSSASIACGAHAGSVPVMTETARRAAALGVAIGAHPSYPDREGFGRRDLSIPTDSIIASFREQVESMMSCAEVARAKVYYVKPHGALYNRAMNDPELAEAIARCVSTIDAGLVLLSLPGAQLATAAIRAGVRCAREGFIDRAYDSSARLVPRSTPNAVLDDVESASDRAVAMASGQPISTIEREQLTLGVDSLCVHSDSSHAIEMMTATRDKLERAGFSITSFARRA